MNTIKKISTLFALALVSQSSFAGETAPQNDAIVDLIRHHVDLSGAQYPMYIPTDAQIQAGGDVRSAMQNIAQNASVMNTPHLTNTTKFASLHNSDMHNNLTSSANAMNSNAGSSYNDSTNNLDTTSTNSSTNTHTTTLDSSRHLMQQPI